MTTATPPALNADEVTVGINRGPGIYLAPAGTDGPADIDSDWDAPWESLGYISDDGVTVGASTDTTDLTPWQSTVPIRTLITARTLTLQFVLWQTNPLNLALYFDTAVPEGDSFDVRSDEGGYLYAVGIDVQDGDNRFRIVFRRAQLSDSGDVTIARGSAIGWDCTLSALDDNGVLCHIDMGNGAEAVSLQQFRDAQAAKSGSKTGSTNGNGGSATVVSSGGTPTSTPTDTSSTSSPSTSSTGTAV
jgi:hypothetical protein